MGIATVKLTKCPAAQSSHVFFLSGTVLPNQWPCPPAPQAGPANLTGTYRTSRRGFEHVEITTRPAPRWTNCAKRSTASTPRVHALLMQRGDIIDRLISVKQTQEVGSALRPKREADMMRRLVQRHRGILPIDTVKSIWRVIISTFTYVQAPFSVHADLSLGESAMRDSARFHFGFTVPYVAHFSAAAAVEAVARIQGDLALVSATSKPHTVVDPAGSWEGARRSSRACRSSNAPTIRPHCRCS